MATKVDRAYVFVMVGATGAVGQQVLSVLAERHFPIKELRLVASEKSQGNTVDFDGKPYGLDALSREIFRDADLAFFSAGSAISKQFAPIAAEEGAVVVDNTSAFRLDRDVPLTIPEVNGHLLKTVPKRRIISVPNCSTIQMLIALSPIHEVAGIKRIVVSTYQSTSGAGRKAMEELSKQVTDLFSYRDTEVHVFPHRIAFDLIPEIGGFQNDGTSLEEWKIVEETKKILDDPSIGVSVTAVRVPTFHCHAESINIETKQPISPDEVRALLSEAPGVLLLDDPKEHVYPLLSDAQGKDDVLVGRIRKDSSSPNCLNLWVVGDNLRKGAALNGIQIFEVLIANMAI